MGGRVEGGIILHRHSIVSDGGDEVVHVCIWLISCELSCGSPFNVKLAVFQLNQPYFQGLYYIGNPWFPMLTTKLSMYVYILSLVSPHVGVLSMMN